MFHFHVRSSYACGKGRAFGEGNKEMFLMVEHFKLKRGFGDQT